VCRAAEIRWRVVGSVAPAMSRVRIEAAVRAKAAARVHATQIVNARQVGGHEI